PRHRRAPPRAANLVRRGGLSHLRIRTGSARGPGICRGRPRSRNDHLWRSAPPAGSLTAPALGAALSLRLAPIRQPARQPMTWPGARAAGDRRGDPGRHRRGEAMPGIYQFLGYRDARVAIEWLCRAFGFESTPSTTARMAGWRTPNSRSA